MVTLKPISIVVAEQNLNRLLVGMREPTGFHVFDYFGKDIHEVLKAYRNYNNRNKTIEVFTQENC